MPYVRSIAWGVVSGRLDWKELYRIKKENFMHLLTELPGGDLLTGLMWLIFAGNPPNELPLKDAVVASTLRELYWLSANVWNDQASKMVET